MIEGGQTATGGDGVLEQELGGGAGEEEGLDFVAACPTQPRLFWRAGKGPSYTTRVRAHTVIH